MLCGALARIAMIKPGKKCPRKVTSAAMKNTVDRLWHGLHPTQDFFFGTPVPFLLRPLTVQYLEDEDDEP